MISIKEKYNYFEIKELEKGTIYYNGINCIYLKIFHSFNELYSLELDTDIYLINKGYIIQDKSIYIYNDKILSNTRDFFANHNHYNTRKKYKQQKFTLMLCVKMKRFKKM